MSLDDILFTEKFRPTKVEHLVLPKRIKEKFEKGIYQNFLLQGPPGTGKTTAAKALVKQFDHPYLYVNVSDESQVETLRNKIKRYASEADLLNHGGNKKVIILDEFDGVSDQFYKAIRGFIEKYAGTVRFIATCNYIQKIPGPVQDRFEVFDFNFSAEEEKEIFPQFVKRTGLIFKKCGMKIGKSTAEKFVKDEFPSFRSILNKIQGLYAQGIKEITEEDIKKNSARFSELYKMIIDSKDPVKNYKFIVENYSTKVEEVLDALGVEFIDWLIANNDDPSERAKIASIIPVVNKHSVDKSFALDPVITLLSCVFSIQQILHSN